MPGKDAQGGGELAVAVQLSAYKPKDKPPADSYSYAAMPKRLAVPAHMLQGITSVQTPQREHMPPSPLKDLTTVTQEERQSRLDGEIRFERRDEAWVDSVCEKERAADAYSRMYASEAQLLKLSLMLSGGDAGRRGSGVVRLMGGPKQNDVASIRKEWRGMSE
ncbi:MAG: hypothetical protein SGPRY_010902, partial [Prymnesium sp.]